jgi:hypothetical protein
MSKRPWFVVALFAGALVTSTAAPVIAQTNTRAPSQTDIERGLSRGLPRFGNAPAGREANADGMQAITPRARAPLLPPSTCGSAPDSSFNCSTEHDSQDDQFQVRVGRTRP